MDENELRKFRKLLGFQVLVTMIAIASGVVTLIGSQSWAPWLGIAMGCIIAVIQWRLFASAPAGVHSFRGEDDPKFRDFFKKWYSQNGDHTIFCRDLDWLSRPELAVVLDVITTRAQHFTVLLSKDDSKAAAEIRSNGGTVLRVPTEVVDIALKMSLVRDHETQPRVIYRKKEGRETRFIERDDLDTLALAATMMKACQFIVQSRQSKSGGVEQ